MKDWDIFLVIVIMLLVAVIVVIALVMNPGQVHKENQKPMCLYGHMYVYTPGRNHLVPIFNDEDKPIKCEESQ